MIQDDLKERILILDGAMGSLLQAEGLTEADFRGERLREHGVALKGNNEVLNLTRPGVVAGIHRQYAEAGAEIIETNTFGANALAQEEYGCAGLAEEMCREGARIARAVADEWLERTEKRVYVAGSMGPTGRSLSLPTGEGEAWERATDFDTMARAYEVQARGLLEGGADVLLLETIYDGLSAKAALYGIGEAMIDGDLYDREGKVHHLSELEGGYILLDFYGTGCYPCRQALPELEELLEMYPGKLHVVGINREKKEDWIQYLDEVKPAGLQWNEAHAARNGLFKAYGVLPIPHYVLISPERKVVDSWTGYGEGSLKMRLRKWLK